MKHETRTPAKSRSFFPLRKPPVRHSPDSPSGAVASSNLVFRFAYAKKLDAFQHPISSGKRDSNSGKKPEFFTLYVNPQSGFPPDSPSGAVASSNLVFRFAYAKKMDAFQHPFSSGKRDSNSGKKPEFFPST